MKNNRIIFLIIVLALIIISGCLQLVPSIRESQRSMSEKATIMSMVNQGQFSEAIMVADEYMNAHIKKKNYQYALDLLNTQIAALYYSGDYENVINSYDKVESIYKQNRIQYSGAKYNIGLAHWAVANYIYCIGWYTDASIQLGEYENIMVVLDKAGKILDAHISEIEKYNQATRPQMEQNLSSMRSRNPKMYKEMIRSVEIGNKGKIAHLEITFLHYKIIALNAVGEKEKSIELWNQFKLKYPATVETSGWQEDLIIKSSILYPMTRTAWLVDDGDYLLSGGKQLKACEFYKELAKAANPSPLLTPLLVGSSNIDNANTMISSMKNTFELAGFFYEAEGLRLTGKYRKAVDAYQNYFSKPEVKSQGTFLWKAHDGLGKSYEALDEKEKASNSYLEAIKIIENERKFLSKDSYKQNFLLKRDHPYDRAIILLSSQDSEKAFHVAEQGKSRALLDLLEGKMVGRTLQARETNEIISKEGRKLQAPNTLASSPGTIRLPPFQTTRASIQQLKSELERTDIELLSMINAQAESYADFNPLMTPDTAIIEYYLTPNEGVIFVGVGENLDAIKIQIKEDDIRSMIRQFVDEIISGKKESDLQKIGNNIFNEILAPALNQIAKNKKQITRLLIVPHGPLHFLPFSALSDGKKWMIEKYEIVQLPSASVLKFCRDKSAHGYKNILAFGNPTVSGEIPELPAAQLEVETIGKLFSQQAKIAMKEDAKETLFRSEGPNYDIVHFACHADFDSQSPSRSALLLSADDQNDGRLEVWEIMQTPLKASFVAMSACNTSLGAISSGDEVVGLSRGMLYAGTPSLLGSLWSIDDKATSIMMASFYEGLQKGKRSTSALRKAQLDLLKYKDKSSIKRSVKVVDKEKEISFTSSYSHPYFWAAFNIIGDWQ